jgi:hypothetical protein
MGEAECNRIALGIADLQEKVPALLVESRPRNLNSLLFSGSLKESSVCERVAALTIEVSLNGTAEVRIRLLDRVDTANGPNLHSINGSVNDNLAVRTLKVD